MKLDVFDNRANKANCEKHSHIVANYNINTAYTSIVVDADIVTIGVTMRVLEEKYEEYLKTVSPEMAQRIREAVGEALN